MFHEMHVEAASDMIWGEDEDNGFGRMFQTIWVNTGKAIKASGYDLENEPIEAIKMVFALSQGEEWSEANGVIDHMCRHTLIMYDLIKRAYPDFSYPESIEDTRRVVELVKPVSQDGMRIGAWTLLNRKLPSVSFVNKISQRPLERPPAPTPQEFEHLLSVYIDNLSIDINWLNGKQQPWGKYFDVTKPHIDLSEFYRTLGKTESQHDIKSRQIDELLAQHSAGEVTDTSEDDSLELARALTIFKDAFDYEYGHKEADDLDDHTRALHSCAVAIVKTYAPMLQKFDRAPSSFGAAYTEFTSVFHPEVSQGAKPEIFKAWEREFASNASRIFTIAAQMTIVAHHCAGPYCMMVWADQEQSVLNGVAFHDNEDKLILYAINVPDEDKCASMATQIAEYFGSTEVQTANITFESVN